MAHAETATDAQLVAQILAGEQDNYRYLIERHQRAVYNAAYRLLGNPDESADIAQDTFLRAYQALDRYQPDKPIAPWLCRIAINLALNRLKQRRPTLSLDDQQEGQPAREVADVSAEPQAHILQAEKHETLRRAILALPPAQRVVIELRHFQEYSYEEIANMLNNSISSVKSRLFRARKNLLAILREEIT